MKPIKHILLAFLFCTGFQSGGTAIQAIIATGCIAVAGTNIITHKYNMP